MLTDNHKALRKSLKHKTSAYITFINYPNICPFTLCSEGTVCLISEYCTSSQTGFPSTCNLISRGQRASGVQGCLGCYGYKCKGNFL
ncbi:hypothetical protein DPMN_170013 [Dreissena polymorpha]|uniref:Uncharacterized protein n=1 Tax=Dreissena polymorpha TaxID=45954 RepID=A0A9D4DYZ6_DREPO|nr:hypothetical protein DPMN_170013 [Dreissena polymorpha]